MGRSLPRAQASVAEGEEPVAGTDDPEKLGLSPVSAAYRPLWDGFYGGVFLPDGYPGRRQPDGSVIAHPLYGTYLLADYLRQGAATGDTGFVRSAQRVAWAAVRRMDRSATPSCSGMSRSGG